MTISRLAVLMAVVGLTAGCAREPLQRLVVAGTVPVGQSYQALPASPDHLVLAELEACLQRAGLRATAPASLLVQTAFAARPAAAQVLAAGEVPARHRASRKRDRIELVLTITERVSGRPLYRASAAQLLPKGATAGAAEAQALAGPLCAAIMRPPAVTPG